MIKNIFIVSIILLFFFTEITLNYFLPTAKTDFDTWLCYFLLKDAVYDIMFFLLFILLYWMSNNADFKAISVFAVIMAGGSAIDKVLFGINQYLISDILVIVIALVCAINVKLKWKN